MANNLMHPLEDPPSLSSSAGEFLFISSQEEDEEDQHTIFSSDEVEPEDPPPRSSCKAPPLLGRRLLTNVRSKRSRKMYTQGGKKGSDYRRLFSEKDKIILLQSIIDSKRKNPLEDKRPFYESMKGSLSFDVTLTQFKEKLQTISRKYTTKEMTVEQPFALNPHQRKCFQLSKAIWRAEGIAFESANGKLNESKGKVTKKRDLVSPRKSSFFLGVDFLKEKWTKVPTKTKKETQVKMKKLHAKELECQKYEEMLKVMKDKCEQDKVEMLNEVTSLIMAVE